MTVVSELTSQFGVAAACQALAVPRSSFYRSRQVPSPKVDPPSPPARSPRALSEEEQSVVRETLNSPRFVDQAPREVKLRVVPSRPPLDGANRMDHVTRLQVAAACDDGLPSGQTSRITSAAYLLAFL